MRWITVLSCGVLLAPGILPAQCDELPTMDQAHSVTDPEVANLWINPDARPGETTQLEADLLEITRGPYRPDTAITARLSVTNNSDRPLSSVTITPRRTNASSSLVDTRRSLAAAIGTFGWAGSQTQVADVLEPGQVTKATVTLDSPFGVPTAGEYPIAFQVTATTPDGSTIQTSERSAISVATPSTQPLGEPATTLTSPDTEDDTPAATLIYPISANSDITPGETGQAPNETPLVLSSESLADELAQGGRLDGLLDALESDPAHRDSRCLAIDPDLLTTIDRMTRGYVVAPVRDVIVTKRVRLRDRWTQKDQTESSHTPGRGAQDAKDWLKRLKKQASVSCTVALPWAGTDLNAVAATGDRWLARQSLQAGTETIKRILGTTPLPRLVIPTTGYLRPQAAPMLELAQQSLTSDQLESVWEDAQTSHSEHRKRSKPSHQPTQTSQPRSVTPAAPKQPVRVLVADNTVWGNDITQGGTASLGQGITAYGYDSSLAATLAATGAQPLTVGYTNPAIRFDYTQDSAVARDNTATVALRQALGAHKELLIMPPLQLESSTGTMLISTLAQLMDRREITGQTLQDYLLRDTASDVTSSQALDDATSTNQEEISTPQFGLPFTDPTMVSSEEITRARHHARFVDELTSLLSNDPQIALDRYDFTAPARREILRYLAPGQRASYAHRDTWVKKSEQALDYSCAIFATLQGSVALIPPGNVYTRTSPSSPLLIVAENRLPLPVVAQVRYKAADGKEHKLAHSIRIPAAGSITTAFTAELPEGQSSTELTLWLVTQNNVEISQPVVISVQTRSIVLGLVCAGLLGLIAIGGAMLIRVKKQPSRTVTKHHT